MSERQTYEKFMPSGVPRCAYCNLGIFFPEDGVYSAKKDVFLHRDNMLDACTTGYTFKTRRVLDDLMRISELPEEQRRRV